MKDKFIGHEVSDQQSAAFQASLLASPPSGLEAYT